MLIEKYQLWSYCNDQGSKHTHTHTTKQILLIEIQFTILGIDIAVLFSILSFFIYLLWGWLNWRQWNQNDIQKKNKPMDFWMANTFSLSMKITSFVTKFFSSALEKTRFPRITILYFILFFLLNFNIHMIIYKSNSRVANIIIHPIKFRLPEFF